jgi:hypothetical protein
VVFADPEGAETAGLGPYLESFIAGLSIGVGWLMIEVSKFAICAEYFLDQASTGRAAFFELRKPTSHNNQSCWKYSAWLYGL